MAKLTLHRGRERPVRQRHPWIFSGAIADVAGRPQPGADIDVYAADEQWLARGTWSSSSQIKVRLFSWEQDEALDADLLRRRLAQALALRERCGLADQAASRLVFAESDGLPGLIVDRYADFLVVQLLTQGMAARSTGIVAALVEQFAPHGIVERSDADVREKEGLDRTSGLLWGLDPAERLPLDLRNGAGHILRLEVDLRSGHKTGLYLDQVQNWGRVATYSAGAEILDCFAYSGGFSLSAARAGAETLMMIESSPAAAEMLHRHLALNAVSIPAEVVVADVARELRRLREYGRRFDMVILDPPKFAYKQSQVERATRGYKDINMLAMQLLRPGGMLATFSCSGLISRDLFQKVLFSAAIDARRDMQIVERLSQAPDHPVLVSFPEGEYLKGLIGRVW
jgi:23S rRNA (cytosine1962-C5)-methyltransferase